MNERPALSKGEMEVARALWELGEGSVGQVHQAMAVRKPIDYSTVQTYIRRLEAKGYLNSRREGRNKIYSAKVRPSAVIGEAVSDLMNRLFDGELLPFMRHMIRDQGISHHELDQLRQLLDELDDEHSESDE